MMRLMNKGKFAFGMMLLLLLSTIMIIPATNVEAQSDAVYVIAIEGTVDGGLAEYVDRAISKAEENDAEHIILSVDTFGGSIESAYAIGERIRSSTVPTTAFIKKALSAGAYISLNATNIVMEPGSTIGSASIVNGLTGESIDDPKTVSAWLSAMTSAAELRGRNPDYAAGMVDNELVVESPELNKVYGQGILVNLTANEANKVGYAEAELSTLDEVIEFLQLEAAEVVEVDKSVAEKLAGLLSEPFVVTLLFIIGLGGIVFELLAPGFGVPGIVGVLAFGLYFFGNYIAGFAEIEHIILFVAGILLLLIEIFVPSFGILGASGVISIIVGVMLAAQDPQVAFVSLAIAFGVSLIVAAIVFKYFKHRGIWNKFILRNKFTSEEGYRSQPVMTNLIGSEGVALTTLRPAGTAKIEDRRIDVVTRGEFIASNTPIVVIEVEGTRVVVEQKNN
ncbi:NfeD family protein [Longirhabdus pacifica]|uniref:NfeD family protein n=1 Tax=Longirhabdus pacifica TaxID=2305227 RepID=UPI0010092011|nr:nodulation protein NfeD [Longirhabdus pacifica]